MLLIISDHGMVALSAQTLAYASDSESRVDSDQTAVLAMLVGSMWKAMLTVTIKDQMLT
jgi:hypothetical protein